MDKPIHPGLLLKQEMQDRALTQKETAELFGVQETSLWNVTSQRMGFSKEMCKLCAKHFDKPLSYWVQKREEYMLGMYRNPADEQPWW